MQYQSSFTQFMAGGVAGVAYWGCIYPLDIIKVSISYPNNILPIAPINTDSHRLK